MFFQGSTFLLLNNKILKKLLQWFHFIGICLAPSTSGVCNFEFASPDIKIASLERKYISFNRGV